MLRTGHIFLWSLAVFGHTSTTRAGWVFFSYEKMFCEDKCMIKTALFSDSASQCDTCSKRILGEQGWFDVIYSTATKLICSKTTCKMRKSQQCLTWFHKDLACGLWHATYTPNTSTLNQTCWKCRLERNDHTKRSKLNTGKIPSKQSRDIVFFFTLSRCVPRSAVARLYLHRGRKRNETTAIWTCVRICSLGPRVPQLSTIIHNTESNKTQPCLGLAIWKGWGLKLHAYSTLAFAFEGWMFDCKEIVTTNGPKIVIPNMETN